MRVGIIAKKIGMTSIYDENGKSIPVTLVKYEPNIVSAVRTVEKDGYSAVQVAGFDSKVKNVTKPVRGHLAKNSISPKSVIKEFRVETDKLVNVGSEIAVDHLVIGQFVDVQGMTKGKGFAGVIKRWHFGGMRASHGVSISHRAHGSTGANQDPGKVIKGKKMAGHMGDEVSTKQNIRVIDIDKENNLIILKGSIPGSKGSIVFVKDAVKKSLPVHAHSIASIVGSSAKEAGSASDEVNNAS